MLRDTTYLKAVGEAGRMAGEFQLHLQKNMSKGCFDTDLLKLSDQCASEVIELMDAVQKGEGIKRIWMEAGDVINFASAIAYECQRRMDETDRSFWNLFVLGDGNSDGSGRMEQQAQENKACCVGNCRNGCHHRQPDRHTEGASSGSGMAPDQERQDACEQSNC